MRTPKELIAELRSEAAHAVFVVLAVGFPNETKMVHSTLTDAEALKSLNTMISQGGYPLGYIRCRCQSDTSVFDARSLDEYADDPVPGNILRKICQRMGDEAERQYGVYAQRLG